MVRLHRRLPYVFKIKGVALQDIVLVRAKEKEPTVVDADNTGAEVLVWADEDQEDYTHKFSIDEYHDKDGENQE